MKFIIEVAPLESYKRIALLTKLESKGIKISARVKKPDTSYTRIYKSTSNISDWSDTKEVLESMNALFGEEECQDVIDLLVDIAGE
ncbi:hypothetical protein V7183_19570 [Bacillus sp. JJ1127]|uniref:hypothetical protein n=1 Tax=Bacillus sp. JJ1127 TaxID=3122952 RepID=UPI002FFFBCD1